MKTAMTVPQLAEAVIDLASRKADLLIPPTDMCFRLDGDQLTLTSPDLSRATLTARAYSQTCEHFGVPKRYADMLRARDDEDVRDLLPHSLDTLSAADPGRRLVRTLNDPDRAPGDRATVRAVLSDRDRRIDNEEVLERILPRIPDDMGVVSANVSDDYLHVKFVRGITDDGTATGTPLDRDSRLGGLYVGVVIRNSEVGAGALTIRPMLYRLVCLNGMTSTLSQRFVHLGAQLDAGPDGPTYSGRAQRMEDDAIMEKAAEAVEWAVSDQTAAVLLDRVENATGGDRIADPTLASERLASRYDLTDGTRESVLWHLARGGDLSRWGAANAITRASQDVESYDAASDLESIGGQLLDLSARDWAAIAAA